MVLRTAVARHAAPSPEQLREVLDDGHAPGSAALRALRQLVTELRDPSVPTSDGASPASLATDRPVVTADNKAAMPRRRSVPRRSAVSGTAVM